MDMSDEGIELRSPFPVVPPVKDSKWGDLPNSADGESRPVEPPVLYPEIGESHPCPFFKGPELNFIHPRERKVKKSPVKVPAPLPVPVPIAVPQIPRRMEKQYFTNSWMNASMVLYGNIFPSMPKIFPEKCIVHLFQAILENTFWIMKQQKC
ncbi:uncharacterized protein [Parasteatoda tepidariorum]|uniref:uncharacterized protein n=1 Tax=Parasteatoda tepidariorum TaxID=114398 RepID=UPI0039BD506C